MLRGCLLEKTDQDDDTIASGGGGDGSSLSSSFDSFEDSLHRKFAARHHICPSSSPPPRPPPPPPQATAPPTATEKEAASSAGFSVLAASLPSPSPPLPSSSSSTAAAHPHQGLVHLQAAVEHAMAIQQGAEKPTIGHFLRHIRKQSHQEVYEAKLQALRAAFPGLDPELLGFVLASNLSNVEDSIQFLSSSTPPAPTPAAAAAAAPASSEGRPKSTTHRKVSTTLQQSTKVVQTAEAGTTTEEEEEEDKENDDEDDKERDDEDREAQVWKAQLHASWREEIEKMPAHKRKYFAAKMPTMKGQHGEPVVTTSSDGNQSHQSDSDLSNVESYDSTPLGPGKGRLSAIVTTPLPITTGARPDDLAYGDDDDENDLRPASSSTPPRPSVVEQTTMAAAAAAAAAASTSERGLLTYECANNRLLLALREQAALRDLTQFAEDIQATILVPISTPELAKHEMTRPFVQTHMITLHGKPTGLCSRFITFNGLEGTLDLSLNEININTHAHKGLPPCQQKVLILRRGTCELHSGRLPLLLVSAPLDPTQCLASSREEQVSAPNGSQDARLSKSFDPKSSYMRSASAVPARATGERQHRRATSVDLARGQQDEQSQDRTGSHESTPPVLRKSVLVARASKPVRSESLMLGPSDGATHGARLPHNAPITVQLAHPSTKKISQQVESFIGWFIKRQAKSKQPSDDGAGDLVSAFLDRVQESMQVHPMWAALSVFELRKVRDDLQHHIFTRLYKHVFRTEASEKRDEHLQNKITRLATFIKPEHLEIHSKYVNEELWERARVELASINNFIAPSEKLMCILNCCRILIYSLQEAKSAAGADDFVPQLVYTIIRANPPSLHSNISYISRFCDSDVLIMENLCFYTHLVFCVSFIEMLQASSLKIDPAEFQKHMGTSSRSKP